MILNTKSWYAWYYTNFYNTELPQSLCKFFWLELFALISFPLIWPQIIGNLLQKSREYPVIMGITINFMGLAGGISFWNIFYLHSLWNLTWIPLFGMVLEGIALAILLTIVFALTELRNKIKEIYLGKYHVKRINKEKKSNWFTEGIKAFFGKYCPRIDWR